MIEAIKKAWVGVLALVAALSLTAAFAVPQALAVEGDASSDKAAAVASIGDQDYETLAAAVADVQEGETVTLNTNFTGDGIIVPGGTNFTLDLGGNTYTVNANTVGSAGTETNGFQLLQGSTITIKNGSIYSDYAKILIQNYSNLTLKNVTLEGSSDTRYVLSNNCGDVHVGEGANIIAAKGQVAFDIYRFSAYPGVTVTVDEGAGKIVGKVEISDDGGSGTGPFELKINDGDFSEAEISVSTSKATITKNPSVSLDAPEGYSWVDGELTEVNEDAPDATVAAIGDTSYTTLDKALAAAKAGDTITLLDDIELSQELMISTNGLTIDGNNHTISAAEAWTVAGQNALITTNNVGITIKNVSLVSGADGKHTLNVYNGNADAVDVVLENLTLDHSAAAKGAPLINNHANMTVKGTFKVITGPNSWYGINTESKYGEVSLTFGEDAQITFTDNSGKDLAFIQKDNSGEEGTANEVVDNTGTVGENFDQEGTFHIHVWGDDHFCHECGLVETGYHAVQFVFIKGGLSTKVAVAVEDGKTVVAPEVPDAFSSLTLKGWYTSEAATPDTKFELTTPITSDLMLYSGWADETEQGTSEGDKPAAEEEAEDTLAETGDSMPVAGVAAASVIALSVLAGGAYALRRREF